MRLVSHLHQMRDVLVVPTVGVDQAFIVLWLARLHVLEDVDVALVCRDQEVAVVDEDKHVEYLLTEVHDVTEESNQVSSTVLLFDFLILDEVLQDCVTVEFVAVVLQSKHGHRGDLDWLLVFIVLAVTEPSTKIVSRSDFDDLCGASLRLGQELLLKLLVCDINGHDNHQDRLFLNAPNHLIVPFDDSISLLL